MARTAKPYPWLDRNGRLSWFKTLIFIGLFLPGLFVIVAKTADMLGARPLNEMIHQFGLWAIRFLFLSLAISPLRRLLDWPRLTTIRRMVGVAAFAYAATHLLLYITDQNFDLIKVASEIVLRIYLAIGFVALLGLTALAVTSTDGWLRRLGGVRWRKLHQLIFLITALALVHYFIQAKADVVEPLVMGGLFLWLIFGRLIARYLAQDRVPVAWAAAASLVAGTLAGLIETSYYWLYRGVDPIRMLNANLSASTGIRPSWYVIAITLGAGLVALMRKSKFPPPRSLSGSPLQSSPEGR